MCAEGGQYAFGLIRPHTPETSDGILTSVGIREGFADADVSPGVLAYAGLLAGTVAMSALEYAKLCAKHNRRPNSLPSERCSREHPARNLISSPDSTCRAAFPRPGWASRRRVDRPTTRWRPMPSPSTASRPPPAPLPCATRSR